MFNTNNAIKKMIGSTKRGGRRDWDGDGVPNKKDCQPRNSMRQDAGEKAVPGKPCWNCRKIFKPGDKWYYYYHGDQDDRVCATCAKKLKHTDTGMAGMSVFR